MEETISPLDNRYYNEIRELLPYFSYESWIKYRIKTELHYFFFLYQKIPELHNNLNKVGLQDFLNIYPDIDDLVNEVLELERKTRHDIKAIEIALRNRFERMHVGNPRYKEFIHFGLTSQDINSIAFSLQLKNCVEYCLNDYFMELVLLLNKKVSSWSQVTMVARTHGQPAIPTTLGKEIAVFVERLRYNFKKLDKYIFYTKIGGAVGTLAAHYKTYPEIDWLTELDNFCSNLGLLRWTTTTQITNYEDVIELSQIFIRINNILLDFCQDIWLYISRDIFTLEKESVEQIGSSTMPQKVNPIDFENAEGNLRIANSGFNLFVEKLSISRMQRDLTDSTLLRNYGVSVSHMFLAIKNICKGVKKLKPNYLNITAELQKYPEMLGEAFQCLLRQAGIINSYEKIRQILQTTKFMNLNHLKRRIIKEFEKDMTPELSEQIVTLNYDNYLGYLNIDSNTE